jgi:aminoglycoside phosphotransferase (APT) family kinase protein
VFVKVVRPDSVAHLHSLHQRAAAAGAPTPAPLGWTTDGLLVLAALPGATLRSRLLAGDAALDVGSVVAVLDALPATLSDGPALPTWGQKAAHYAELVARTVPALARRARAVATAVDHVTPEGPPVGVHGDFYEAQLLVSGDRVTGLLDLDTAGRGERLDDAACLLAHLDVLALIHPGLRHPGPALRARFERDLDPAALARRTAAVVLSLATGPFRAREPGWVARTGERIALAESWLDRQ